MNSEDYSIDTLALRANLIRSQFGEHSEAIFPTVSFVYKNAAEAAARFAGEAEGYMYSRFTNPSVDMFEQRLAAMEGGEACKRHGGHSRARHGCVPERRSRCNLWRRVWHHAYFIQSAHAQVWRAVHGRK
jgi:cystathionine beta-lyase/cystathionine gamma-synthase